MRAMGKALALILSAATTCVVYSPVAMAAGPATKPATGKPALPPSVAAVAQFVDENTLAVAAIDVAAIDPESLNSWMLAMLKAGQSPQNEIDGMAYGLRLLIPPAQKWVGDFSRAGGKGLFLVISADPAAPMLVVAPLEGRPSVPQLSQLLFSPLGIPLPAGKPVAATRPGVAPPAAGPPPAAPPPATDGYYVDRFGPALVLGNERAVRRARDISLRTTRPNRLELLGGLAESGPGGIRVGIAMPETIRGDLRALGPRLPAELGGEPTAVLTDQTLWAVLSMSLPTRARPQASVRLTARATTPEAAKSLGNILKAVFRTAANDGDLAKHPDKDKVLALAEPKVVGDTVEVLLTQQELMQSAGVFGPMAIKARREAAKTQSETRLKNLATAIRNAAIEQGGRMPLAITDPVVLKYVGTKPGEHREALTNPLQPDRAPGYQYVRPADNALQIANPLQTVMLYELHDQWPADGIRVAFAAGNVGVVKTEAELKQLLRR